MKTKLLRKVRKRFEILYHPVGIYKYFITRIPETYHYEVIDKNKSIHNKFFKSKNDCLDWIMLIVRNNYKHTRKVKYLNQPYKIWYNPPKTYVYRGY